MPNCHCGLPLHYSDPEWQAKIERLIADLGEYVSVSVADGGRLRTWLVQRHFVALHGLSAADLLIDGCGFTELPAQPLSPDAVDPAAADPGTPPTPEKV